MSPDNGINVGLIISIVSPVVVILAAGIAFFRYILPRIETRLDKLEERVDDMQEGYRTIAGCSDFREECQKFLCGKIETVGRDVRDGFKAVHSRINLMDAKREKAKDKINGELSDVKTELASLKGAVNKNDTQKFVKQICDAVKEEIKNGNSGTDKT